jgi:hypothetical protein
VGRRKSNLPLKYNIKRRIDRVKSSQVLTLVGLLWKIVVEKVVFMIMFLIVDWGCCASHIYLR